MTNLHRQALHLAYFTIAYNVVECVLALVAGSLAGASPWWASVWTAWWSLCPAG